MIVAPSRINLNLRVSANMGIFFVVCCIAGIFMPIIGISKLNMVNRAKKPDQKKPNVSKHCMPERGPNMSTTPINKKTRRVAIAITPERFFFLFKFIIS